MDGWRPRSFRTEAGGRRPGTATVEDATRDSNVSSYIAVGVYHHFLITGDLGFLKRLWPTLEGGVDYAVGLQADTRRDPLGEKQRGRRRPHGASDRLQLRLHEPQVRHRHRRCSWENAVRTGKRP